MNIDTTAQKPPRSFLYLYVLLAIAGGVAVGAFWPSVGEELRPLGDAFIKLVKMIIGPVIFVTIASGVAAMKDLKSFGAITLKAMIYFFVLSTLALIIGLLVANGVRPGDGMNIDPATLDAHKISDFTAKAHETTLLGFVMGIIPNTLISAFVDGQILQVLLVAVIFGIGLVMAGDAAKPAIAVIDSLGQALFRVVDLIMRFAPVGAFGAMAFTVGKYGIASILSLIKLVATFYATSALFIFVGLGLVGLLAGFNLLKLLKYINTEIWLVLGTASSESALPSLMKRLEAAGARRDVVGLVVPTGYSFNLDGTNIYLTLAALFIAQATNIDLSLEQQIALLSVAIVSSKGAAGVTGAGFITLAATLSVVPTIPVAGMALILGVDRFMSECRSLTNLIGNAVAALVVARWHGALDKVRLKAALDGKPLPPVTDPEPVSMPSGLRIGEKDAD